MPLPSPRPSFLRLMLVVLAAAPPLSAQAAQGTTAPKSWADETISAERYVAPPAEVARLVGAPRESNASYAAASPVNRRWFPRTIGDGMPTLAMMAKPYHNLGGFQVDIRGNRSRGLTTRSNAGYELYDRTTGKSITVQVPAGARVGTTSWSPDGTTMAYLALFDDATHIYLADAATGRSRPLTRTPLLATHVTNFEWTAGGKAVVAVLLPDGRGAEPKAPAVATEPMVRVNEGNKLKTRTYADLLESTHDKALLEYYSIGQLAVIDAKSRAVTKVGAPGMIRALSASPDGTMFRVTYQEKPFSYVLPVSSFGSREVIIDATGKEIRELSKRPLREGESTDSIAARPPAPPVGTTPAAGAANAAAAADTAKRSLTWHPFKPGMTYLQQVPAPPRPARAAGDSAAPAAAPAGARGTGGRGATGGATASTQRPDRLMHWAAPFDSTSAAPIYQSENRIVATRWSDDGSILFTTETTTRGTFEYAVFLADSNKKVALVTPPARATNDSTAAGGRGGAAPAAAPAGRGGAGGGPALVMRPGSRGGSVVMRSSDGKSAFLQGSTTDTVTKIARPWVDRVELATGTRTRIYEGKGDVTESISTALDDDFTTALVQRESATQVPQSYLLTLATGATKQLTNNQELMPEIRNAITKTVTARRADGYSFRVKVTLPADYKEGTRLPAMFWFYPREYATQEAYNRGIANAGDPPTRFPSFGPRSMSFLTTVGYAVVEPDAPIFASEGQLPNDNYVVDLRNNLAATIDALDSLGYIDRHRLGIGGHSYGAFSTVNAMVHTPFFKAGIAGDGAYNRTLTPNGFQSEGRDLWQGRQTYLEMSPFLYADQLNGALLLYHSTDDQNVGTDPINSTKLYHALQGLGKTVSLYMYPYEDHGPVARETVMDQWARWVAWLDKYVKNANKPAAKDEKKLASEE
ncbi:MAG TPA: prolyl oligopeptidase family serine peptidase [Gemmatimonadales bacterium]|nr:prolyl oligopeptidase family serine peptidase [Gemmatimonadales bacterium]